MIYYTSIDVVSASFVNHCSTAKCIRPHTAVFENTCFCIFSAKALASRIIVYRALSVP